MTCDVTGIELCIVFNTLGDTRDTKDTRTAVRTRTKNTILE